MFHKEYYCIAVIIFQPALLLYNLDNEIFAAFPRIDKLIKSTGDIENKEVNKTPLNIGTPEILIILLIALILLGPSKLPQLARSLGEAVKEFRKASSGLTEEVRQATQPIRTEQPLIPVQAQKEKEIDYEIIKKLAQKLEITTEGKSEEELIKEIISKAKEKGLLEEKQQ
jgi:sec-independent protein translocase protein TatA